MRITTSCICGSDLHPSLSLDAGGSGPARMGRELIGVVEAVGAEVATGKIGDLVVAPFDLSDNTCQFCWWRPITMIYSAPSRLADRTAIRPTAWLNSFAIGIG